MSQLDYNRALWPTMQRFLMMTCLGSGVTAALIFTYTYLVYLGILPWLGQ